MSEQAPRTELEQQQFVQEYVQEYPNAIVDRDKAEEVAYVSKSGEERVVELANIALKKVEEAELPKSELAKLSYAEQYFDEGVNLSYDSEQKVRDMAERQAVFSFENARETRLDTDELQRRAGIRYDVKTGAAELKSGKSLDPIDPGHPYFPVDRSQ